MRSFKFRSIRSFSWRRNLVVVLVSLNAWFLNRLSLLPIGSLLLNTGSKHLLLPDWSTRCITKLRIVSIVNEKLFDLVDLLMISALTSGNLILRPTWYKLVLKVGLRMSVAHVLLADRWIIISHGILREILIYTKLRSGSWWRIWYSSYLLYRFTCIPMSTFLFLLIRSLKVLSYNRLIHFLHESIKEFPSLFAIQDSCISYLCSSWYTFRVIYCLYRCCLTIDRSILCWLISSTLDNVILIWAIVNQSSFHHEHSPTFSFTFGLASYI